MDESRPQVRMVETSLWSNRKCLVLCCIMAISNLQYGFDTSAVGALQAMPGFLEVFGFVDPKSKNGYGIDPTFQQLISSLMTLGSFLSSLVAGPFALYFGRKHGVYVACGLTFLSVALQIGTTAKGLLYFGRLLLGMANGFFATFSTIYLAEAAPVHQRGVFTALFKFWIQFGNIIGTLTVNYTKTRLNKSAYRIPLGCLFIIPTFLCFALFFVPESPRYLLLRGKDEEARKALETLRFSSTDDEFIELEWIEMVRGRDEENKSETREGFLDLFRGTDLRRTLLCYGIIAMQTAGGIWFVIAYQTYFFTITGVSKPFEYSLMNTCLGFAGCICGMILMRHFMGRRTMLGWGAFASGVCHLVPAIGWTASPGSALSVNLIVSFWALFYFFYSISLGVATYPAASEVVSTRLRALTVGSATSLGQLLAWLCTFCTPYFINPKKMNWGSKYQLIWAGANFLSALFVYFCLPEMKGRSLEELDELFAERVSVKNFRKYHSNFLDMAALEVQEKTDVDMFTGKRNAVHVEDTETTSVEREVKK